MTDRVLALVPVRSFHDGKSRLACAVRPDERRRLITLMLDHVLETAMAVDVLDCRVISSDPDVLRHAGDLGLVTPGEGLNQDLSHARAVHGGNCSVLALHADLPLVGKADLEALLEIHAAGRPAVAAADKFCSGTNALLLAADCPLPFLFGSGSLTRFATSAQALGVSLAVCNRPGLALDIDTPADLAVLGPANGRCVHLPDNPRSRQAIQIKTLEGSS